MHDTSNIMHAWNTACLHSCIRTYLHTLSHFARCDGCVRVCKLAVGPLPNASRTIDRLVVTVCNDRTKLQLHAAYKLMYVPHFSDHSCLGPAQLE